MIGHDDMNRIWSDVRNNMKEQASLRRADLPMSFATGFQRPSIMACSHEIDNHVAIRWSPSFLILTYCVTFSDEAWWEITTVENFIYFRSGLVFVQRLRSCRLPPLPQPGLSLPSLPIRLNIETRIEARWSWSPSLSWWFYLSFQSCCDSIRED